MPQPSPPFAAEWITEVSSWELEGDIFRRDLLRLAEMRSKANEFISARKADEGHLAVLRKGAAVWNRWRRENPTVTPNLAHVSIRKGTYFADLRGINLIGANLYKAFITTDLSWADLSKAFLRRAYLPGACLQHAQLGDANLHMAALRGTDLRRATLTGADLRKANISGAKIYGASVWDAKTAGLTQKNLMISPPNRPEIATDSIEVAQFIYLMLENKKIREIIDTISQKGVLILGRFTKQRKAVLDAIREKLRNLGFVPMMFDFERPKQRDFTETIKTLAGLSRFIIADITNPKSSPLELQATMPDYMIPFVPIIHEGEEPFLMFRDLTQKYGGWVLDVLEYNSTKGLLDVFEAAVVQPALEKAEQLLLKKTEEIRKRHVNDYKR